jgi:hypothetical protein
MPGATDAKPTKPLKNPCNLCQSVRAILKRPKTGQQLCKECFFHVFETEIHNTIVDNKLFNKGDRVAIGASGGKGMLACFSLFPSQTEFLLLLFALFSGLRTTDCLPDCGQIKKYASLLTSFVLLQSECRFDGAGICDETFER